LHERLLGRPTFRYLRALERSQWFAPADLRVLQRAKLRALLQHARENTRFYRRRLAAAGVDVRRADPFDALAALPLLTKSEIRTSLDAMVWSDAPGGVHRFNTGGSTGEPLIFYLDRRRQAYDQAARIRSHRWFGVDIGDRELYLWGSPIEVERGEGVRRLRDALFNHRLLSAFNMSRPRMDGYLDAVEQYRPACLFGYPSSLALLAEHARRRGRSLDTGGLRAIFVTGEVCYPHQREVIGSVFRAPVADGYGSRDAGFIAHECPEGRMHLTGENVIVEIMDVKGVPLPAGEAGEIVVTHLDAYAMPFIRYRTGDVGRLEPGRCSCGRGLPMLAMVQGRTTDFLCLPDGTVRHALSIIYPLRAMPGVCQFRVTQNEDLSVIVDVVADDRLGRITADAVTRRVRPVVGDRVGLDVRLVGEIAGERSGKFRYVLSYAKPAGHLPYRELHTGG
jgi:phenylacetate-CoA ligase